MDGCRCDVTKVIVVLACRLSVRYESLDLMTRIVAEGRRMHAPDPTEAPRHDA
jgi:hypothetical protein